MKRNLYPVSASKVNQDNGGSDCGSKDIVHFERDSGQQGSKPVIVATEGCCARELRHSTNIDDYVELKPLTSLINLSCSDQSLPDRQINSTKEVPRGRTYRIGWTLAYLLADIGTIAACVAAPLIIVVAAWSPLVR